MSGIHQATKLFLSGSGSRKIGLIQYQVILSNIYFFKQTLLRCALNLFFYTTAFVYGFVHGN
jgi:hypothetical protein